jgi:hypothetical protein
MKHYTTLEYIYRRRQRIGIYAFSTPKNTRNMIFQVPSMSLIGVNLEALLSQKGIQLVGKKPI